MDLKPKRNVCTQVYAAKKQKKNKKKNRIPCLNFEKGQNSLRGGLAMLKGLPSIALHVCTRSLSDTTVK